MADFTKSSPSEMAADNPGIDAGTQPTLHETNRGNDENYCLENFASRPYVKRDRGLDFYGPANEVGTEAATRHRGRQWDEVEADLSRDWSIQGGASGSRWEDIKDAVRDAWDRVAGAVGGNSGIDWEHRERGLGGPEALRDHTR